MAANPAFTRDKAGLLLSIGLTLAAFSMDCKHAWGIRVLFETPKITTVGTRQTTVEE